MSPQRIEKFRGILPEGAVFVGRPTKWGNPFEVYVCPCCRSWDVRDNNGVTYLANHEFIRLHPNAGVGKAEAVARAVELYGNDFRLGRSSIPPEEVRAELAGKDLACWCPLSSPCHADVLLELANAGEPS